MSAESAWRRMAGSSRISLSGKWRMLVTIFFAAARKLLGRVKEKDMSRFGTRNHARMLLCAIATLLFASPASASFEVFARGN